MRRIANRTTIFLTILVALLFPGCAKHDLSVAKSGAPGRLAFVAAETERLYVLTASQTVEVKEIAAAVKQVDSVMQKSGGYVQSQSVREKEQAYLVLRVPAPQFRPVLDAMAALGKEESRSVSSQDVTEQYIDTEARLKNAIALRDRLKALLGQAKGVKDILEIEKERAYKLGWEARRPLYAQRISLQEFRTLDPPYTRAEGGTLAQVHNCIKRLRQKIEPDPDHPRFIRTVRNEGYMFVPDGK